MIRIEFPVEIDRPVAEVFDYLTDPARLHEWQTNTTEATVLTSGPMGAGTRLKEVHKGPFGKRLESLVEVSAYEPCRRFDLRILEGPLPIDGDNTLHDLGGRTRIDVAVHGRPRGAMRALEPLLRRTVERQMKSHYAALKAQLESDAQEAPQRQA